MLSSCGFGSLMSYSLASYMAKTFVQQHFSVFSYFHYCASRGVLFCLLYFLVFSWLSYLFLIKTAMKILRKMRTLLVYFHLFCTSVFPTSNLMSSQRPTIFRLVNRPNNKLLSIAVSFLSLSLFFFLFPSYRSSYM